MVINQNEFTCSRLSNQYVEQLPIPKIPESAQKPFIDLVDKILECNRSIPAPDDQSNRSILASDEQCNRSIPAPDDNKKSRDAFVTLQAKVKEYEGQIDQLVYKLYGLTEEE